MSEKTKVILDVDTGSDDAIAMMLALLCPRLEVLGITTVNGNLPVSNTTENTLRVVELLNAQIPVYPGCAAPLVSELLPQRHLRSAPLSVVTNGKTVCYHREYLTELPAATTKPQPRSAVCYLIDTLLASQGDITIVAVAPLTNLAVAMRADPRIVKKIKRLVIMGGGHLQSNVTSAAEFNFWKDPEAAQIVLQSGCDILLVPLDATHRAYAGAAESRFLRQLHTPVGDVAAGLLDFSIEAYNAMEPLDCAPANTAPLHDALAVCAVIEPQVLGNVQFRRVDVDFSGGVCDGMAVIDRRMCTDKPANVHIALDCDRERFIRLLLDTLASAK